MVLDTEESARGIWADQKNQVFCVDEDTEEPAPEIPVVTEAIIQLKVRSKVRIRTLPNTSIFSREIRMREAG